MLLERLVALSLVSLVLVGTGKTLAQITRTEHILERQLERLSAELEIESLLRFMLRELDSSRFGVPPKIESAASTRFGDGSPLQLPGRAPMAGSDAVSFMLLENRAFHLFSPEEGRACPYWPEHSSGRFQFFAAASLEGFTLVRAKEPQTLSAGCITEIDVSPVRSLLFPTWSKEMIGAAALLIPVEAQFLVYLTEKKTLRYLGFEGDLLVENQPIGEGAEALSLKMRNHRSLTGVELNGKTLFVNRLSPIPNHLLLPHLIRSYR